mmetsp:Transcript_20598/g.32249  ORF Transcript_20598/g.32249 Transcript_20598/m.32249 type:complete len:287 (-) Transcript_20598:487-1347(-)
MILRRVNCVTSLSTTVPFESNEVQPVDLLISQIIPLPVHQILILLPLTVHPLSQRHILLPLPRHIDMTKTLSVLDKSFIPFIPWGSLALLTPVHSNLVEEFDALFTQSWQLSLLGIAELGNLSLHPTEQLVILTTFGRDLDVTMLFLELFQKSIILQPFSWPRTSMGIPNKAQLCQQQNFVLLQLSPTLVLALPPRPPRQSLDLLRLLFRHILQIRIGHRTLEVAVSLTFIKCLELEVVGVPRTRFQEEGLGVLFRVFLGGGRGGFVLFFGIIDPCLCLGQFLLRR